ncbi:MAG TPA: membrane protein insertase YidC, partial [Enterovirga sp.]
MRHDNKNLLLAIALSVAILIGWNYFYGMPQVAQQRQAREASQTAATPGGAQAPSPAPKEGGPSVPNPATLPAGNNAAPVVESREAALARSPRIRIDTPQLSGSIALKGGRVDDVSLKTYRETVDPKSPQIVLLSPSGSANPYYAEFGWVGTGNAPNADTLWTADSDVLSPGKPVTLTWDNGAGLVFRRQIGVDEKTMLTIADAVENRGSAPVTLYPFGLVSRHGRPVTQGYYVLHEGLIGVLGDQGLEEFKYESLDKEPLVPGQNTHGRVWNGVTGGFLGITDKYWAAAVIPDQSQPYQGSFTSREDGPTRIYQANMLGDPKTVQPGATAESTQRLFAGAKEVEKIDFYKDSLGIKKFDLLIDWGWFYFIT